MIKLSQQEKDTIEKIKLFSGLSTKQSRIFFDSLFTYITLNFMSDRETVIPFFGSIKIKYDGEEIVGNGKEAKISLEFKPNYKIKKVVGQIIDDEEDNDVFEIQENEIKNKLEEIVCTNF